jgi:formylmethanofuran dehydrogenase subunit E
MKNVPLLLAAALLALGAAARPAFAAPSEAQWVEWGTVVHGGFGSHIALGVRIGEDALQRLKLQRRELQVVVTEGAAAPCACVADGLTIATSASAGQRSLLVLPKSADTSFLALIEVQPRNGGERLVYRVPASAIPLLAGMNASPSPQERYQRVMAAPASQLFTVEAP